MDKPTATDRETEALARRIHGEPCRVDRIEVSAPAPGVRVSYFIARSWADERKEEG